ncbi:hypothetical protein FK220_011615 [Flavobacteriaceae bacterium TP-CH-4]|uniref:Thoeris protein ThsB TIR-like domain-containing protein n=1 Tax=Pelagihabitans pacificus TaxID=2696054 RepID=A0A967ATG4_9FLAO|nr:TIR domain-containing protein [Pelagihabitans pacificus]NHF59993.1 hypothetical protein [Pelagihabitans pacificus]
MKYNLFISYSTDPDYELSRKIESFLESFHNLNVNGEYKLKKLNICRDGSDFELPKLNQETNPKLHDVDNKDIVKSILIKYLEQSENLLVLCSRNSALSDHVGFEIEWFLNHKPDGKIFLAVTEGKELNSKTVDFFAPTILENGLPYELSFDFRQSKAQSKNWKKVKDFNDEITGLASQLNGFSSGELRPIWRREQEIKLKQEKSKLLKQRTFLIVLALIAAVAAGIAFIQKSVANERAKIAESRSLALQSNVSMDKSFEEALLLASQSYTTSETLEAKGALLEVLNYNPSLDFYMPSKDVFQQNGLFDRTNDSILITHGFHDELRVWNLQKRQMIASAKLGSNISTINMSENGKILVAGHINGDITVLQDYPSLNNRLIHPQIGDSKINSIAFVTNNLFAFTSQKGVSLYNLSNGKETILSSDEKDQSSILVYKLKDSTLVATGSYGFISFWDLSNPEEIEKKQFTAKADIAYSMSINEDENFAAIGYHDGTVSLWDLNNRHSIGAFPTNGRVLALQFIGKSKLLISSDEGQILLRDLRDVEKFKVFRANNASVNKIIVDRNKERMVSLSRDGKIAIYNLNKRCQLIENKFSVEVNDFPQIDVSPDVEFILLGAQKELFTYNIKKKSIQLLSTFRHDIKSITIDKSGTGFVTSHSNGKLISWSLKDKKYMRKDSIELRKPVIDSKSYSNNKFILRDSEGKFFEFDFSNSSLKRLKMPTDTLKDEVIAFQKQAGGHIYAIALNNFKVILYDSNKNETLKELEFDTEIRHLLFTKDGSRLLIADWNKTKVWSMLDNRFETKSLTTNELPISKIHINEDPNYIIAADNNKAITIWDLNSLKQLGPSINGFISNPQFITYNKESKYIIFIDSRFEIVKTDYFPFEKGRRFLDIYELNMGFDELNDKVKGILNNEMSN